RWTAYKASPASLQSFDDRRSVVDFEALAFKLSFESDGRGIRKGIGGDDFEIVSAIGKRGGVPGIIFLVQFVLQQFPFEFVFAAIVDGIAQVVVVIVVGAPQNGLIALFAEALWRLFELWRRGGLRDEKTRSVWRRRHLEGHARRLTGRNDRGGLCADAWVLQDDGINDRSDVSRQVGEADPVNPIAGAAIVDDGFPLEESRARSFDGAARFRIRAEPAGPFLAGIFGVARADEELEARFTGSFRGLRRCGGSRRRAPPFEASPWREELRVTGA